MASPIVRSHPTDRRVLDPETLTRVHKNLIHELPLPKREQLWLVELRRSMLDTWTISVRANGEAPMLNLVTVIEEILSHPAHAQQLYRFDRKDKIRLHAIGVQI